MKKKILFRTLKKFGADKKTEYIYFGENIELDFNDYNIASFLYRKNREFKQKDFKPIMLIDYYSDTLDIINARILFMYTSKRNSKVNYTHYDFKIANGNHKIEFRIPIHINQLKLIQIDIYDYKSNDDRYTLRFNDIKFLDSFDKS